MLPILLRVAGVAALAGSASTFPHSADAQHSPEQRLEASRVIARTVNNVVEGAETDLGFIRDLNSYTAVVSPSGCTMRITRYSRRVERGERFMRSLTRSFVIDWVTIVHINRAVIPGSRNATNNVNVGTAENPLLFAIALASEAQTLDMLRRMRTLSAACKELAKSLASPPTARPAAPQAPAPRPAPPTVIPPKAPPPAPPAIIPPQGPPTMPQRPEAAARWINVRTYVASDLSCELRTAPAAMLRERNAATYDISPIGASDASVRLTYEQPITNADVPVSSGAHMRFAFDRFPETPRVVSATVMLDGVRWTRPLQIHHSSLYASVYATDAAQAAAAADLARARAVSITLHGAGGRNLENWTFDVSGIERVRREWDAAGWRCR